MGIKRKMEFFNNTQIQQGGADYPDSFKRQPYGGGKPVPPSYKDQIRACILALKERSGSSLPAIKKFLGASPAQYRYINAALRSGVASGFFIKNKGKYKLSPEAKKGPVKKKEMS